MISNLKHIKMIKRRCIHLRYISTPRKIISFSSPVLGDEEIQSVSSVIMGGRMVMGPKVSEFESMVCNTLLFQMLLLLYFIGCRSMWTKACRCSDIWHNCTHFVHGSI